MLHVKRFLVSGFYTFVDLQDVLLSTLHTTSPTKLLYNQKRCQPVVNNMYPQKSLEALLSLSQPVVRQQYVR